jgi:transcriptional regulator NrdR family protein
MSRQTLMPCPSCATGALRVTQAHNRRGVVVRKRVCDTCGLPATTREAIRRPAVSQANARVRALLRAIARVQATAEAVLGDMNDGVGY